MVRRVTSKVMWVGRATVFLVGLAVSLALVFGVAATALAGTGVGAPFNLGETNRVDAISRLVGAVPGGSLVIDNNSAAAAATALDLRVEAGRAPLKVNSSTRVTRLNADLVDGLDSSELGEPRGFAFVKINGGVDPARSKGVNDVVIGEGETNTNLYCFDLTFTPRVAVGSPFINNSAVVATATLSSEIPSSCPQGFRDAAARTFASQTGAAAPINFMIVFV